MKRRKLITLLGGAAAIRRSGTASRGVRDAVTQRRSRDATDVTNHEAAICWDGAA